MLHTGITPQLLATLACQCLREELETYPKPGLVSLVDCGSHPDLNADLFYRSIDAIEPSFQQLAKAGAKAASFPTLQAVGIDGEAAMLRATGGRNTHRGAIFTLGLLTAAAALRFCANHPDSQGQTLGQIVRHMWGHAIAHPATPLPPSHGQTVCQHHGLRGARGEAASGFSSLYRVGLPVFRRTSAIHGDDAARVQTLFALITTCEDTTTVHRGGPDGWLFARQQCQAFLDAGGVEAPNWRQRAEEIHHAFVRRNLTAGGAADLLAATLFVAALEETPSSKP